MSAYILAALIGMVSALTYIIDHVTGNRAHASVESGEGTKEQYVPLYPPSEIYLAEHAVSLPDIPCRDLSIASASNFLECLEDRKAFVDRIEEGRY
jgi:hypothetical protein